MFYIAGTNVLNDVSIFHITCKNSYGKIEKRNFAALLYEYFTQF